MSDAPTPSATPGLEPVASPPLEGVTAIRWLGRQTELLVACESGQLAQVDPVGGTRILTDVLDRPAALAADEEEAHVAVATATGWLEVWDVARSERRLAVDHGLRAPLWCSFWHDGLAVVGTSGNGRQAVVTDRRGGVRARVELPGRSVMGVSPRGRLLLGQVTVRGPEVVVFGRTALSEEEASPHDLQFTPQGLLFGRVEDRVTVWSGRRRPPITIRCPDLICATISQDSTRVGLGTTTGIVALAGILATAPRKSSGGPGSGHSGPVQAVDFAAEGRWLASAGDRCWLWTW